ncbi:hypothetical protein [Ferrovibrio xuzhouensis]|uniref:Polyketide cyclase / dehydrase and lipid transport n=1 Tax=Ferrovibrio xuzhouensis TaxID=1576914 RepID=A0ABV7VJ18_9PROT
MPNPQPQARPATGQSNTGQPAQDISTRIDAPFAAVDRFLADPLNWPLWAAGLGTLSRDPARGWTTRSPDGRTMRVDFAPAEAAAGIHDHTVTPPDGGAVITVPLRAAAAGDDATLVTLTLIRQPEMDDAAYARDAEAVAADLQRLKATLERH